MVSGKATFYLSLLAIAERAAASCNERDFRAGLPEVLGVEYGDIVARRVEGWNAWESVQKLPTTPATQKPLNFCEVNIAYTHTGLNDTINISVWLPKSKDWNGRFLGQGGHGWAAAIDGDLAPAVAMGFAAAHTDAGHSIIGDPEDILLDSSSWGLTSPGNVNLHLLQSFGYRSLDELAIIAKRVIYTYYDDEPEYSYWQGCGTGGRQGLALAQHYPEHFQGILAASPVVNWVTSLVTAFYPHIKMNELDYRPSACELEAITKAAIEACDNIDGVPDGIISDPDRCYFDALSIVGQEYSCGEGDLRKITKKAAIVANSVWFGPVNKGRRARFGLPHGASLAGLDPLFRGLATTECDDGDRECTSHHFGLSADWIKTWVLKDPDFDLETMDEAMFYRILRQSELEYESMINTGKADLGPFKAAGGKIVMWHGLADELFPANSTTNYYSRVARTVPKVRDFFRYFAAAGVGHCGGGNGHFPLKALYSLMLWVEKGKVPESLDGQTVPGPGSEPDAEAHTRPICAWPKVASFKGQAVSQAKNYECSTSFSSSVPQEPAVRSEL